MTVTLPRFCSLKPKLCSWLFFKIWAVFLRVFHFWPIPEFNLNNVGFWSISQLCWLSSTLLFLISTIGIRAACSLWGLCETWVIYLWGQIENQSLTALKGSWKTEFLGFFMHFLCAVCNGFWCKFSSQNTHIHRSELWCVGYKDGDLPEDLWSVGICGERQGTNSIKQ